MTKDERFLLEVYQAINAGQDTVNPLKIGEQIGFTEKQVKTIIKHLFQANLLKKFTPTEIGITPRGSEVAAELR